MFETRNSWLLPPPPHRKRRTTDHRPQRVSQSRRRSKTHQGWTGKSSWQSPITKRIEPAELQNKWFSNSDSDPGILFPHSRRCAADCRLAGDGGTLCVI